MKTIVIPFSGFYESIHDSELDTTLERMFSDRETGCDVNAGLQWRAYDSCDWRAVHEAYAKDYAERFACEFEIVGMSFESLQSPREYNFTTDRIFCHITDDAIRALHARVPREDLDRVAREMFTSRDGFASFYSPDVDTWGDVCDWDHNQLSALLVALVGEDWDQWKEYDLMSGAFENGNADEWIASKIKDAARLFRVHDYLNNRAERA